MKITADVLQGNTRLRAIARAGVGVDNIDTQAATRQGIVVMNTPGGNTISTAEHTIALMLGMSRNVAPRLPKPDRGPLGPQEVHGHATGRQDPGHHRAGPRRPGRGHPRPRPGNAGPRLRSVPARSQGQGVGHRNLRNAPGHAPAGRLPHRPHAPERFHEEPHRRQRGADAEEGRPAGQLRRGGIYDEAALVEGLKSGQIAGVALDVYPEEPCTNSPLFGMPGVLCTPHLGASTEEAQTSVAVEAAELLIDFFTTGAIKQSVNMSPLDPKTLAELRGYLNVSYRLGLLLAQMDHSPPTSCRLSYKGEVAKKDTRLLSSAFAAGLLEHALAAGVNIVNAEVLLRDRGIEVIEQRNTEMGDFSSVITAEVVTGRKTSVAAGTLFGNNMPRLVQKGNCRLESYLDGVLMIFAHRDQAGRHRQSRQHLWPAPGQHRPDVGRPLDEQAGRRRHWHPRARFGPARRGVGGDHGHGRRLPGVDCQAAASRRVAPLDGRVTLRRAAKKVFQMRLCHGATQVLRIAPPFLLAKIATRLLMPASGNFVDFFPETPPLDKP